MAFTEPTKVDLQIEQDEILRGIRDRIGFKVLRMFLALEHLTGSVLMITDRGAQAGTFLFWFAVAGVGCVSVVEWRFGIRRAAKEQIDQTRNRQREIRHENI